MNDDGEIRCASGGDVFHQRSGETDQNGMNGKILVRNEKSHERRRKSDCGRDVCDLGGYDHEKSGVDDRSGLVQASCISFSIS